MRRHLAERGGDPGRHDHRHDEQSRPQAPPAAANDGLEHTRRHTRRVLPHAATVAPGPACRSVSRVELSIEPASDAVFRELETWRYAPPYDFYDGDVEPVLNPERYFAARDASGELVGFYYFEEQPPDLDYGLGLRPDLVGRGLGLAFFRAGIAFAHERYRPRRVRLHVAEFNERARRVYERAGFEVVSRHVRSFERFGEVPFLTMAEPEPG